MTIPAVNQYGEGTWNFGLPFELNLQEDGAGASLPRLYICVNSADSWNRYRVEGYSHVDIPLTAGMYQAKARCWKPCGTIRESVQDFFIGGSLQLLNRQHPAQPGSIKARCLSYHGFETATTGTVHVRFNVIVQHCGAGSQTAHNAEQAETMRPETQADIDDREIEAMELRARLVQRAQDRVNKYAMLEAGSAKKTPVRRRSITRKTTVREAEATTVEPEEAGGRTPSGARRRTSARAGRRQRQASALPPMPPADQAEAVETNELSQAAGAEADLPIEDSGEVKKEL